MPEFIIQRDHHEVEVYIIEAESEVEAIRIFSDERDGSPDNIATVDYSDPYVVQA